MKKIKIGKNTISRKNKTYFIADIAANHDGSISRAKKLIRLCAKAGADAAKFQHFKAETIISPKGFKSIGKKSHQSKWKKSVFETYQDASVNFKWTKILREECLKNNIDFMTAPYDLDYVDKVEKYVAAYKIGSGDLNWHRIIKKMSKKKKPMILATGASNFKEVIETVNLILKINKNLILMQCNTNYSNEEKNFQNINLNVLKTYKKKFGDRVILGLSDHTPGHSTVLGAVALGARVVEKHFTENNNRNGPDHKFSMNFETWRDMIKETRRLENSLGNGIKEVEKNEKLTSHIQRRSFYALKTIPKGKKISLKSIFPLRPFLKNSFSPDQEKILIGKKAKKTIKLNECIKKNLVH